jgi:hypothetical protein
MKNENPKVLNRTKSEDFWFEFFYFVFSTMFYKMTFQDIYVLYEKPFILASTTTQMLRFSVANVRKISLPCARYVRNQILDPLGDTVYNFSK